MVNRRTHHLPLTIHHSLEKEMANTSRATVREAIHRRIRRKVKGNGERPRLAVYRSLNHIYAQVVDDQLGKTIVSASTTEKDLRGTTGGNLDAARRIGKAIAERALEKGISSVVFDRGGYLYHGRIKALTDAAREAGLNKNELEARAEEEPAKAEENVEVKAEGKPRKKSKEKQ
jgi:large subunit ribosomal protein L18